MSDDWLIFNLEHMNSRTASVAATRIRELQATLAAAESARKAAEAAIVAALMPILGIYASYNDETSNRQALVIEECIEIIHALIEIAEASLADRKAQEAVMAACLADMNSDAAQAAFQAGHDADRRLATALERVEKWRLGRTPAPISTQG